MLMLVIAVTMVPDARYCSNACCGYGFAACCDCYHDGARYHREYGFDCSVPSTSGFPADERQH